MIVKPIKLSEKRNGKGYVTSYTVNLGCAEVRDCGLLDWSEDGELLPIEKVIDKERKSITIRARKDDI